MDMVVVQATCYPLYILSQLPIVAFLDESQFLIFDMSSSPWNFFSVQLKEDPNRPMHLLLCMNIARSKHCWSVRPFLHNVSIDGIVNDFVILSFLVVE